MECWFYIFIAYTFLVTSFLELVIELFFKDKEMRYPYYWVVSLVLLLLCVCADIGYYGCKTKIKYLMLPLFGACAFIVLYTIYAIIILITISDTPINILTYLLAGVTHVYLAALCIITYMDID